MWKRACFCILLILTGCSPSPIENYQTLGELRVATRMDAISYFKQDDGAPAGFEYDLVEALARELNVLVRFIVYPDAARAIEALIDGQVHIAAAGLARNDRFPVNWSPALRDTDYVLAGRSELREIAKEEDLSGLSVNARRGSPIAAYLLQIQERFPEVQLEELTRFPDQQLLGQATQGTVDLIATDKAHFALAAQIHPDLEIKYDLPLKTSISWALPLASTDDLAEKVNAFLTTARKTKLLDKIADRYFSFTRRISGIDAETFLARIDERLPEYRPHFEAAADETGIDWRYLAALAYQESHWDPLARSPTGVRGMMMLTSETANHLGVKDRLNAAESIRAGARYLASLRDSLPDDIVEPDRTWMATAAYNLGMGHLNGARAIARSLKKDDTSWWEMKSVLPLLSKPAYAARLKSGPARGGEAVIMTDNIRNYHGILSRIEPPSQALQ